MVESYWPERDGGARAAQLRDATRALRADGRTISFLGALLVPDDDVCFLRFACVSLADVAAVSRHAGITVHRVARSVELPGEDVPPSPQPRLGGPHD